MKVVGFSFIKNALLYDFPIVEAITSILPICDEFVIAVGKSDDNTLQLIKAMNSPKIRIIETIWNESLRKGGRFLADETNKAYAAIDDDADWCFYIQGDEVFHENDLTAIQEAMVRYKNDKFVEGLVFEHINFYGTYDFITDSRHWHKREIRVIRKDPAIVSYKDAMSFRKKSGVKLHCKYIPATIYHYGWVKNPKEQLEKRKSFGNLWLDDELVKKKFDKVDIFDYSDIESLKRFEGSHPSVMGKRIKDQNWTFNFDPTKAPKENIRRRFLDFIYRKTGWHIGEFKNYILIK